MTSQLLNHWQACWSLELAEFNFKLSWTPGLKNPADGPSRCPDYVPQEGDTLKNINFQTILKPEHMDLICTNPPSLKLAPTSHSSILIAATLQSIDSGTPIAELKSTLALDSTWHKALEWELKDNRRQYKNWLTVDDFILFRDWIYILPLLCPRILFELHDLPIAGHPGQAKTIKLIAWDYSWPRLLQDVWWYVHSCDLCQRNKAAWHAPYGDLNPLEVPSWNWESISMDLLQISPLPMVLTPFWWWSIVCLNKPISYLWSNHSMLLDSLSSLYPPFQASWITLKHCVRSRPPLHVPFLGSLDITTWNSMQTLHGLPSTDGQSNWAS